MQVCRFKNRRIKEGKEMISILLNALTILGIVIVIGLIGVAGFTVVGVFAYLIKVLIEIIKGGYND